jgi:hypothetical protein
MTSALPRSILLLGASLALAASSFHAAATPYASGIDTSTPGSISFILNENADDVKILFDAGSSTNDLGAQSKGKLTFNLGTATNYQIVVTKKSPIGFTFGAGTSAGYTNTAPLKMTVDTDPQVNFYHSKGVTVNYNPKSPYFGRIYVANDGAGACSTFVTRSTTAGIYVLNADQSDALSQGDTALTGGLSFGSATDYSPSRIRVGEDDNLYICDTSDATGNLYMADPNVSSASGLYALKPLVNYWGTNANAALCPVGTDNTHGSVQSCYVGGSLAAGNLAIYTLDQDLQSDKVTTTKTELNSLWKYAANAGPLPYTSDPTKVWTATGKEGINFAAQATMDLDVAPDGKFFLITGRANGSEAGLIVRDPASTTTLFSSLTVSLALNKPTTVNDYLKDAGAVAVSRDDKWVAVARRGTGAVWVMPLTNGVPDLSKRVWLATSGTTGNNNALCFDAANNLYIVNNGMEAMRVFSPGGTSITTYSNDLTGLNGSFSVVRVDPDILTPPQTQTANAGSTATYTVTASGAGVLGYQWTKNGANISGATKTSYALANVQQASVANYAVVVTNTTFSGSITSAPVSLIVVDVAPAFTTDLAAARTVNAGTNSTFTVAAAGTTPITYQWYFNDLAIAGATNTSYARTNLQNLTDAGTYYVVASNAIAPYTTTSTKCVVTINESAPVITANPANVTTGAGNNVTFTVTSYGTDPRTYQWQMNAGSGFADLPNATGTSLTLTNVQVEDTGKSFQLNIRNSLGGPVTSTVATLTVTNKAPLVVTAPTTAVVGPGDSTNFTVLAQGENPLTFQWMAFGTNLVNGGAIAGATTASLQFNGAQLPNAGFYSVVVTSTGGAVTSSVAQLVVTNPFTLGSGTGLQGEYRTTQYKTFTNAPTLTRVETNVDFSWGTGSPDAAISVDYFTARWVGQVQPLYSQDYTFYTYSDDGSRLWVNGQLVVSQWADQGAKELGSTPVTLVAGQKYDLVMEYYDKTSSATASLRWSSPSQLKGAVPTTQLYPASAPAQPKIQAGFLGSDLVLQWMGTYTPQAATDLTSGFSSLLTSPGIGPFTNGPAASPSQFFRLKAY